MRDSAINIEIGRRIRHMREFNKWTRENFVERADISAQFLAEIESGNKGMSVTTLVKIVKALSVTTDYLVFGREQRPDLSRIVAMLETLSGQELALAEELLTTLVKSFNK